MKRCVSCKKEKWDTDFYKDRSRRDGLQARCKECTKAYSRQWKKDNPEAHRSHNLKYAYGITTEQYGLILQEQNYQCMICKADQCNTGQNFAVDHDHKTGAVRGLLCQACNTALGKFKDNPELLRRAARYLEVFDENFTF